MIEFDALTRSAYALVPHLGSDRNFRVTLDDVEMANLYLDTAAQEWALTADDRIGTLPAPFAYRAYTFPTWSEMTTFLGIATARPVDPDANTAEDKIDDVLRMLGRTTYGELRAELARWNETDGARLEQQMIGGFVAENRRLRTGFTLVAAEIGAATVASAVGDGDTSINLLVKAKATAERFAAYDRPESCPPTCRSWPTSAPGSSVSSEEAPVDKRLTLLYRPPFAVRSASEPVIVDADGEPIALALPGPTASTRMLLAEAIAAGLNAQCGVPAPAIGDRLDPHHIAAAQAESRQQAARRNSHRLPDAAE